MIWKTYLFFRFPYLTCIQVKKLFIFFKTGLLAVQCTVYISSLLYICLSWFNLRVATFLSFIFSISTGFVVGWDYWSWLLFANHSWAAHSNTTVFWIKKLKKYISPSLPEHCSLPSVFLFNKISSNSCYPPALYSRSLELVEIKRKILL